MHRPADWRRSARADPAQLVEAQTAIGALERFGRDRDHAVDGSGGGLRPSVDGVVVHASPIEVVTARADENVPLLIGTNLDEGTLFSCSRPTSPTTSWWRLFPSR